MKFTFLELARCAEREVALRKHVYPGLIERKKMTVETAELELEKMLEIARQLDRMQGLFTVVEPFARAAYRMVPIVKAVGPIVVDTHLAWALASYQAAYCISGHQWEVLAKAFGEGAATAEGARDASDTRTR